MGVLQRTIDGVSVWIAPASVTANFGGTHCPRSTIHSSVFGRLWKVTNELRNGLESKTCGPINIRARRFSPFFPHSPYSPHLAFSLSFTHCQDFPAFPTAPQTLKLSRARILHCVTSLYIQTGSTAPLIRFFFFFPNPLWFLATKLYPDSLQCSVLFWGFLLPISGDSALSLNLSPNFPSGGVYRFGPSGGTRSPTGSSVMTLAAKLEDFEVTLEHLLMDVFVSKSRPSLCTPRVFVSPSLSLTLFHNHPVLPVLLLISSFCASRGRKP